MVVSNAITLVRDMTDDYSSTDHSMSYCVLVELEAEEEPTMPVLAVMAQDALKRYQSQIKNLFGRGIY